MAVNSYVTNELIIVKKFSCLCSLRFVSNSKHLLNILDYNCVETMVFFLKCWIQIHIFEECFRN